MRLLKKRKVKERGDEKYLYYNCPHCSIEIKIPRCRNCIHIDDNYDDYQRSVCKSECDMFHRAFKKKKSIEHSDRIRFA